MEDGCLIPVKEQLSSLGLIAEEFCQQESLDMPKHFIKIWIPFLTHCNKLNLMSLLFEKLMHAFKSELESTNIFNYGRISLETVDYDTTHSLRMRFIVSWIVYLLKFNSFKSNSTKSSKFYFEFNVKSILKCLLELNSGLFSSMILNE